MGRELLDAAGIRGAKDIGGTGLFDAEYIVASKAWGHLTLAGAWLGYLGTSGNVKNPFCTYSDKFCYRDNSYQKAGSINGDQMFHGPAALFGGGVSDAVAAAAPEAGVRR